MDFDYCRRVQIFVSSLYVHVLYIVIAYVTKGAAKSVNTNGESRVFWLSLVVAEVFWVVFVFAALITLSFKWFVSDHLLTMCIAIFLVSYFNIDAFV